jgi:methylphosphotriester-DNA--protein-cysteine methyltransferase
MHHHIHLGTTSFGRSRHLKILINTGQVTLGGNRLLKIYGTLDCRSGKRMKVRNRVFFADEAEALQAGFRPCGHCLPKAYNAWKTAIIGLKSRYRKDNFESETKR